MSDEYLIQIVARLRDEAAAGIANLKREIAGLKADAAAADLSSGVGDLADEAERATQAHKDLSQVHRQSQAEVRQTARIQEEAAEEVAGHAESLQKVREQQDLLGPAAERTAAQVRQTTEEHARAAESVAEHASAHAELAPEMQKAAEAADEAKNSIKQLQNRASDAQANFDKLGESFHERTGDLRSLRLELQASSRELNSIAREFQKTGQEGRDFAAQLRQVAEDAKTMSRSFETAPTSKIALPVGIDKARQVLQGLTQEFERFQRRAAQMEDEDLMRSRSRVYASQFGSLARQFPGESAETTSALMSQLSAQRLATPPPVQKEARDAMAESIDKGDQFISRMRTLDQAAQSRTATNKELEVGYQQVASGLRSVWKEMEVGSSEARRFGSAMEDAVKKSKNIDLARSTTGLGQFVQEFSHNVDQIGIKVISLSAALRGVRLVALAGFLQPLLTGLTSLAAGFFSVASGAAQAAATIGGVFVSGLGQLVPMASIAIASLIRLRDVFQAVQAAQAARQEAFFQPNQGLITQLQNTNQLIQSEQSLKNAYYGLQDAQVQVRQSQIQLTQARIDAIRNLQDLVIAEQSAKLALSQSNLSVVQAQQALQKAQASGSQQAIEQAQLQLRAAQISQEQARYGVPRAEQNLALARRYGVSGSPTVLAATEAARQARLAVTQQEQAIALAQRQLRITRLTLAQPASHETQQQATLQYLLGQMSPVEKALFGQLNRLETELRSPNSPLKRLTDSFLQPFVYVGQRLQVLLGDPKFLEPITKLADAMGRAGSSVFHTMFGARGTSFFETMAKDATSSLPVVTKAITGLMKVFEDIATAAAPAFKQLSGDWARFWDAMDKRDRSAAGQRRLTEFFDQGAKWAEDFAHLAGSIVRLFMALGHDAAPQGMKTVTSFTEAIRDATRWVQQHGPEVTSFFSQARQGLALIGGVLLSIGKAIVQVFSLTSLQAFAAFLNTIVIPAARDFANVVGLLVKGLLSVVDAIPGAKGLLEGLVVAFIGLLAIGRVITMFNGVRDAIYGIKTAIGVVKDAWNGFKSFLGRSVFDYRTAMPPAEQQGAATTAATTFEEAIISASKIGADEMGAAIRAAGGTVAEEIKAAEIAGGTSAGAKISAAEVTGGAGVATEIAPIAAGAGAGGIGAGEAVVAGGGAGLLSRLGTGAATLSRFAGIGAAGYAAYKAVTGVDQSRSQGLAGLLGDVPKNRYIAPSQVGTFGGNVENALSSIPVIGSTIFGLTAAPSQATVALQSLQKQLQGISDPTQLSTRQLRDLRAEAEQILHMPDITASIRGGLRQLITALDPTTVAFQKAVQTWQQTFSGLNVTVPNVLQQLAQTTQTNFQTITTNFKTGTTMWSTQVQALYQSAYSQIQTFAAEGVSGTQKSLRQLNAMLNKALGAVGGAAVQFTTNVSSAVTGAATGILSPLIGHAAGGWHAATPGGRVVQVGEGGHDEVTLTTDPRHAPRQRALLGAYLSRVMAKGGYVGSPSVYQSPFGSSVVTWGRTDMGVDLNLPVGAPIGAIGNARVVGVQPNWYAGQPYLWYQLTDGPDKGRYVYVAEQISGVPGVASNDPRATSSLQSEIGKTFMKGQRLAYYATSGTGIETGWGTQGWQTLQQATLPGSSDRALAPGTSFRSFLQGLTHGVITGGMASQQTVAQQLTAPRVQGVRGIIGQIAQGIVDKATQAANQYLMRRGVRGTGIPGGLPTVGGGAPSANQGIARSMLGSFGWGSPAEWNALNALWTQESGWSTTALNKSSGAYGIAQALPASKYASVGSDWRTNPVTQIKWGLEYIKSLYGDPLAAEAHERAVNWYAAGGLITRHLRRIGLRHLRRKVMRFAAGGRAPWGGEPVPIIAHDGERIANPMQWGEVARMAGTTPAGLDRHLGYDTGSPRQTFAPGGIIQGAAASAASAAGVGVGAITDRATASLSSILGLLQSAGANLYKSDPGSVTGALGVVAGILKGVGQGFSLIGKLGGPDTKSRLAQINNLLGAFADPNNVSSTLNLLAAAFQRFQTNLSNWVARLSYVSRLIDPRQVAQAQRGGTVTGTGDRVRLAGPVLSVGNIGTTGTTAIDLLNERSLVAQGQYIEDQARAVQRAISEVTGRIKKLQAIKKPSVAVGVAIKKLESQYTNLVQQQETLTTAMNGNISSRFQQEQQYVQDALNQVSDVYQTQQAGLQAQQSSAQSLGQYAKLPSIDQALAASAAAQKAALAPVLRQAQKANDADLVAQIQQQIQQLNTTISQATAQMVQDQLSGVEQTFQTQSAQLQGQQTTAQTLGRYGDLASVDQSIVDSINAHIAALQQVLAQAQATGNQGLAAQIQQEIAQLQGSVAQAAAQLIQDAVSNIQQGAQTTGARVASLQAQAQTQFTAAATPGQFAAAGALNLQALNLNQTSLQSQLAQYNALLGTAQQQGNTGAIASLMQTIDSLTSQLAANSLALRDNTAQVVAQTSQFIQARGQFQTGILGGLGQIIQTIGQTTGYTDVASLKALMTGSNTSLQGTQTGLLGQLAQLGGGATGLASLLGNARTPQAFVAALSGASIQGIENGQDQTWINTFEGLISNLESNTQAIAQNNQQLATLNGQLLQPQTWSTTAWTAFRNAIFSGMGNLLPQFQNVLPPGAAPMIAPVFRSVSTNSTSPTIGTLSINHAPTTTLDPQIIGQQLAYEISAAI